MNINQLSSTFWIIAALLVCFVVLVLRWLSREIAAYREKDIILVVMRHKHRKWMSELEIVIDSNWRVNTGRARGYLSQLVSDGFVRMREGPSDGLAPGVRYHLYMLTDKGYRKAQLVLD